MEAKSAVLPPITMMTVPREATALGTLLHFLGSVFYCGKTLLSEEGVPVLEKTLHLLPKWHDFARQSELIPLAAELDKLRAPWQALCTDTQARQCGRSEYDRLFHAVDQPIPLWESLWLSPEKLLFTEETTAVRHWYRRFGLDITRFGHEAEDHLGLELAFCGWLYETACQHKEAKGSKTNLTAEKTTAPDFEALEAFIREHPGRWALPCLSRLQDATRDPFWQPLFGVGHALMQGLCCPAQGSDSR